MDYDDLMGRFHQTLKIAARNDAMLMVMDTLIKIAELLIEKLEKERAVEILAFVLCYPMRPESRARAETLYLELEAELCPRVLLDARRLADELTLDDLLEAIIGAEAPPDTLG
ncbi:MAG: hypothetical protein DWB42_16945 [Chloroflexi bacterium]|jgi:hypothetical protein|nr:hypothetical protein [Chloroflexota bacterium]MDL1882845.1 hypothetical protein [Anaerolineae bacterium CFX8]